MYSARILALSSGVAAAAMRRLPAYERSAILRRAFESIKARRDEIAHTIAGEVGKALKG